MQEKGFNPYSHCILACVEEEQILFDRKGEMVILGAIPPENIIGVIEWHPDYPELIIPISIEECVK